MTDINALMARALLAGGITLPACEDPMRGDVEGDAYITWTHEGTRELWASGERFQRRSGLQVTLWILSDSVDWIALRDQVFTALDGYRESGASILVDGYSGAQGWDVAQGREIGLQAIVVDDLWQVKGETAEEDAADADDG